MAQVVQPEGGPGFGITSMIAGIFAILGAWTGLLNGLVVIAAIVFGIIGVRRQAGKGMAIAGLIMGGIGFILTGIFSILWLVAFLAA